MALFKPAKLLTTLKNIASPSLNEKIKIRNLTKQIFLTQLLSCDSVFRICIINKRVNICI